MICRMSRLVEPTLEVRYKLQSFLPMRIVSVVLLPELQTSKIKYKLNVATIHESNLFWHFNKLLYSYDFSSQSVAEMPLATTPFCSSIKSNIDGASSTKAQRTASVDILSSRWNHLALS